MDTEFDYDLTPDQWETLKALRMSTTECRGLSRSIVDHLVALGLVTISDGHPRLTSKGRSVLLRGSPRLLDLAA
jgi:ribosomal protein S19E (S16A)